MYVSIVTMAGLYKRKNFTHKCFNNISNRVTFTSTFQLLTNKNPKFYDKNPNNQITRSINNIYDIKK